MNFLASQRSLGVMAVGAICAALIAGCSPPGNAEEKPLSPASGSAESPATAPASPSAEAGETESSDEALSEFEDDPAVQGMRGFYSAIAKATNQGDFTLKELQKYSTQRRQELNESTMKDAKGLEFPGPIPFTPIKVRSDSDDQKTILACGWDSGWAKDKKTGKPRDEFRVDGGEVEMLREDGNWKVNKVVGATIDCSTVDVKKVEW
ncbi:hypothetical protein LWF01_02345 [Saxibacter everestensis]|uniref:DUF3828 domain-containing protein n=1 Tax=Saxibacter everestensis TaxID=2909229 RepID=A0ABY8QW72_9MICO|nr:hypothetical protein LWF01_02345 [Brevibacteriaceae bacterium ZFBP1038]